MLAEEPTTTARTLIAASGDGAPGEARARRTAVDVSTAAALGLTGIGVLVWLLAIHDLPLSRITDVGLASVYPPGVWIGMGLVAAGCAVAWRSGRDALMVVGLLATILVLHGAGVLGEPTMRFATTWQHVGIADYIATHGSVDPNIDAYFNWPGFFILSAFLSQVAGWDNIEPLARVAPLFYNAMYLVPLVAIGRALFADRRVVWLGVWLFYVSSWIGQDYYSPQGFAFFMYLVVIAVVLRWFRGPARVPPPPHGSGLRRRFGMLLVAANERLVGRVAPVAPAESRLDQRIVLVVVLLLIATVVAASHQLTPFAMVSATAALCIVGWCRLRTLPVAILLIAVVWALYMASTYLSGHLHLLVGDVGAVDSTVNSNVSGRLYGSEGHAFIVRLRVVATLVLWVAAMLGFLRQALHRRLNLGLLALALSPFPLLALQSYGGEVLLRIAFFCLPFMAFAAATLFVGVEARPMSRKALVALACFAAVLLAALPYARYGNERMDYYSKAELAAVDAMYRIAPDGASLFAGSGALPWRFTGYADHPTDALLNAGGTVDLDYEHPDRLARNVAEYMSKDPTRPSYLVITRSMAAQADLFGYLPHGAMPRLRAILAASPLFRTVYANPDGIVLQLSDEPAR